MNSLTRRGAIGFGVLSGLPLFPSFGGADDKKIIFADDKAVLFKFRGVTIERVDRDRRSITASFGEGDKSLRMANLPLPENFLIRVSYIEPGTVNNVPLDWNRLEGLVNQRISMMLLAASDSLIVDSIAMAND